MNQIVKDTLEWLKASGQKVNSKEELLSKIDDVEKWALEEIREFREAVEKDDKWGQANAVVDAHWILTNLAHFAGLTSDEIDNEGVLVRASNFSKFCFTREEAQESVTMYAEGTHPNKLGDKITVIYKATGNKAYPFVLLRASDGKILKSHKFQDVDVIKKLQAIESASPSY